MALKDKLMTLEDFKAVRDVDVASNSAQFTEIKADLATLADITPIPDNSDLNNYTETGLYSIEYGIYTILNYPPVAGAASYLEVRRMTNGFVSQKLTIPGNGKVFTRRKFNNGAWNDWIQIAEISNDLMTQGKAADSKITGDAISTLQADLNDLDSKVDAANEDLGTLFKWVSISGWISDGFIDTINVSPVVLTPSQQPNEPQWRCAVLDCAEGDIFLLNIVGGYNARAWAFLDNTNTVVSMSQAQTVLSNAQIVAPEGAVKLILNDNGSDGICYKRENKADLAVKYDEAQTLTNEEKSIARINIGAASQADISEIMNNSQTFAVPYEFFTAITSLLADAYYRTGANPAALDLLRDTTALYVYDGCIYISRYYNGFEAVKSCRTLIA